MPAEEQPISHTIPKTGSLPSRTPGGMTYFTYDAKGNVSSYKDPTGALTQIQRDSKGNITSVTDPLGHTAQYGYDQYNNVISVTDPTNVAVNLTRDILGNVLSLTDALNNTTILCLRCRQPAHGGSRPAGECGELCLRQERKPQFGDRSPAKRHNLHLRLQGPADAEGGRTWENHRFFLRGHGLPILRRGRREAHVFDRRGGFHDKLCL